MNEDPYAYLPPYDLRVLSPIDARDAGYESLTTPYNVFSKCAVTRKRERALFEKMCDQMNGCNAIVAEVYQGYEVWRHHSEMNIDPKTGCKITSYIRKDV